MPTSGDLKSGDTLFSTTRPPTNWPSPQWERLRMLHAVLHEVHTIKIHNHHFDARNSLYQFLNMYEEEKFQFWAKDGLNLKLRHRKAQKMILSGRIVVTRTGEQEIGAISGRLLDNPGELACMGITYVILINFKKNRLTRNTDGHECLSQHLWQIIFLQTFQVKILPNLPL